MAKGTTPLNQVPRSWAGGVVVDTNSLGTNAVTANELASNAVTTAKIAANAVTAAKIANNTVTGAQASGTLASKVGQATLPTVATTGTTEQCMVVPFTGTISGIQVAFKDALAQHATNYLTFAIVNKTQANAAVLAATDANTTKTTTGFAISAYTTRVLALGTGAVLNVAQGDVLALQFISAATLANTLTEGFMNVNVVVAG
jgi:hypothetical protein